MDDFLKEISQLDPEQQIRLLSRRLKRSENAREEAERLLERRARELALANSELLQREERLRDRLDFNIRQLLAAQRAAAVATIYRVRGGKTALSPEFGSLLGLPPEREVTPDLLLTCTLPIDRRRIAEEEARFYTELPAEQDHTYEHRIKRLDNGETRWLRWTLRRSVDENGQFASVSGTVQDITEQRQATRQAKALSLIAERRVKQLREVSADLEAAREAQQKNSAFLQTILDTLPQGIAVFDVELKLLVWNESLADIIEFDRSLLKVGMPFMAAPPLGHEAGQQPPPEQSQPERDEQGRVVDQSYERQLSDGRIIQVEIIGLSDGGMIRTYADITRYKNVEGELRLRSDELASRVDELVTVSGELRKSRAEAEQANRYKSQFLTMMSHDIRTPMNGVLGLLDTLANTPLDDSQRGQLELARQSGRQLSLLLSDIIEIVRAESGKIDLRPEAIDIGRTLRGIVSFWQTANDNPDIELSLQIDPDLPEWLQLDPTRFRQLLDNLVSNAIKYAPQGETVISARRSGPMLRLEVTDNGPGIAAEQQEQLFADFARLRGSTASTGQSAGLGLAICRRLVLAMGGQIGVESALGEGSTFWFEVPLVEADLPDPETSSAHANGELRGALPDRVLVAEDIETNRVVLTAMLDQLGCSYLCVENGQQAIEALASEHFDCILMDVNMPVMDGQEATVAIRAMADDRASVPIVGVTAHALPETMEQLRAAGMTDLISKPLSLDELTRVLRKVRSSNEAAQPALFDEVAHSALFEALPANSRNKIARQALQDIERLNAELAEAARLGRTVEVQRAAHSLKGVAANIGAEALASQVSDSSAIDHTVTGRVAAQTLAELRRRFDLPGDQQDDR